MNNVMSDWLKNKNVDFSLLKRPTFYSKHYYFNSQLYCFEQLDWLRLTIRYEWESQIMFLLPAAKMCNSVNKNKQIGEKNGIIRNEMIFYSICE